MRDNINTTVQGSRLVLVPYRKEHVELYHKWMKSPFLQETTGSEPLTLEEEYEMQRSWAEDADKLTFIVLDRSLPDTPGTGQHGGAMAGDVNLFFMEIDRSAAEIEVMIAEERSRRKGLAREALRLLMAYSVQRFGVKQFVAKIKDTNDASMHLFRHLGFVEFKRVPVFHEVHFELNLDPTRLPEWLQGEVDALHLGTYDS